MSSPGMNMQNEAASALQQPKPPMPQSGQQPAGGAQPAQGGGMGAFMQAFARCEQTKACTPQDRAILAQGLPNLIQIVKMVQMLLQASQPQQQGAQPQAPAPQAGP